MGDGFGLAGIRGSLAQDEIVGDGDQVRRSTGKSGGTEGGMSTGELFAGPCSDEAHFDDSQGPTNN